MSTYKYNLQSHISYDCISTRIIVNIPKYTKNHHSYKCKYT